MILYPSLEGTKLIKTKDLPRYFVSKILSTRTDFKIAFGYASLNKRVTFTISHKGSIIIFITAALAYHQVSNAPAAPISVHASWVEMKT